MLAFIFTLIAHTDAWQHLAARLTPPVAAAPPVPGPTPMP
jgi:hypothetical protein